MKNTNASVLNLPRHLSSLIGLLFLCLMVLPARVRAPEDPPGCYNGGGFGPLVAQPLVGGGINFNVAQAHIGDTVQLLPTLGVFAGGCRATNATGSVYIAANTNAMPYYPDQTNFLKLTNFLINLTIAPDVWIFCPSNNLCEPGPYNLLLTPALVGAGVCSPNGCIPGLPKVVRAVENGEGLILTGDPPEYIADFHTASLRIVTPCIQVVELCAYPSGTSCFPANAPVQFTGYVTNCGDIRLTNVTVIARSAPLLATNGLPLPQPLTLDPGQAVGFQGSFTPTLQETSTGSATNVLAATARDTTAIGGPNAAVTNSTTGSCAICLNPHLSPPTFTPDGQFQFNVAGRAGSNYLVQVSTNLGPSNWLSLLTNAAPFTFVESNAVLYPVRFYRAMFLP